MTYKHINIYKRDGLYRCRLAKYDTATDIYYFMSLRSENVYKLKKLITHYKAM